MIEPSPKRDQNNQMHSSWTLVMQGGNDIILHEVMKCMSFAMASFGNAPTLLARFISAQELQYSQNQEEIRASARAAERTWRREERAVQKYASIQLAAKEYVANEQAAKKKEETERAKAHEKRIADADKFFDMRQYYMAILLPQSD